MTHQVTVLTRKDCGLCILAEAKVERICAELGIAWHTQDVDNDPELRAEYGDQVPVILIDGRQHSYWRVEEKRFRAALAAP